VSTRSVIGSVVGFAALLLMLYFCALPGDLPASGDNDGLAGTYTVNGIDPLEAEYSGTVVIVEIGVNEFDVEWIVTGGIHRGIGTRIGPRFEVEWQSVASGGGTGFGTAEYEILDDGRLVGTRSVDGFDRPGTEEIFPEP